MKPKEFREIREKLGLTQKELAEVFGLSSYLPVNHYESGFRTPSVLIQAVMRILNQWPEKKRTELLTELKEECAKLSKPKRKGS
nr:hypothetical protein HAGR004_02910 [Bdellovibrio sp. HAGR004]